MKNILETVQHATEVARLKAWSAMRTSDPTARQEATSTYLLLVDVQRIVGECNCTPAYLD
jgi:hypothetical protein